MVIFLLFNIGDVGFFVFKIEFFLIGIIVIDCIFGRGVDVVEVIYFNMLFIFIGFFFFFKIDRILFSFEDIVDKLVGLF